MNRDRRVWNPRRGGQGVLNAMSCERMVVDGLAAIGVSIIEKVHHGHVVEVDTRDDSHMPELVGVTPSVKESGELLLWEAMSIEQQTRHVCQTRLEEWSDKAKSVGESLGVGRIGQRNDSGTGHAKEDKDTEVAEAGQIEKWVEGQDATNDAHAKGEGHEDPLFTVAKEAIMQRRHDRGGDQDTNPDIVECSSTAHDGQTRVAEEGMVEGGADQTL